MNAERAWLQPIMSTGTWQPSPPATTEAIAALRDLCPAGVPESYFLQLSASNGGEGSLGLPPGWVSFWPAETVMASNAGYSLPEFLPGFFGFGSNGAGVLLAFDLRVAGECPVAAVPFTPMDADEAVVVARSFDEFRCAIGQHLEETT